MNKKWYGSPYPPHKKKKHPLLHLWDKTFIFMTINLFMKKKQKLLLS